MRSGCVLGVATLCPFSPCCLCMCPCGPSSKAFSFLLLSGLSYFASCSQQSPLCCCAGTSPFPALQKQSHSRFIHLRDALLCYWFLLDSPLQLFSCPLSRAGSSLELCARAEPSSNHPVGTGRSPRVLGEITLLRVLLRRQTQLGSDELKTCAS